MNDDTLDLVAAFNPIEQVMADIRNQLDRLQLRQVVDPDGELSTLDRMLRLKRGSRRV